MGRAISQGGGSGNRGSSTARQKTSPRRSSSSSAKPRYPFVPKNLNLGVDTYIAYSPTHSKIVKGKLQLVDGGDSINGGILNFLFNPQSLNYSSAVMQQIMDPQYRLPDDTTHPIFPGTTTLSFDLLFDRTYEMYLDPINWHSGTLHDMAALNKITNFDNGYLLQNRVKVSFGSKSAPSFDGMVASVNVNHQKFNGSMVPMTTTVGLQFTQLTREGDPWNRSSKSLDNVLAKDPVQSAAKQAHTSYQQRDLGSLR